MLEVISTVNKDTVCLFTKCTHLLNHGLIFFFLWTSWLGEGALWIQISRGRDLRPLDIFHSSRLDRLCSLASNSKWRPVHTHYVCKINTKRTWWCKPYLSMVLQLLLSQNLVSHIHIHWEKYSWCSSISKEFSEVSG